MTDTERRYVDVSGHAVTNVNYDSPQGPTGICPESGKRVYCREVTDAPL
jgi:hypothetical protein